MGIDTPVISLASPAFADSDEEAEKALALFGTCPVADRATRQNSLHANRFADLV